ncbi:MAG: peptide chain release factor N(5)-glutamine methyltransferase [Draconibacterium sp.]|nr:peptide chain release factor N(5)-glutamine methyltransferase [Draconibacterium sp.]
MKATIQYINSELAGLYPVSEIEGFIRIIFEAVCGMSFTEQVVKRHEKISVTEFERIEAIILRLKFFEPIQYILGETEFYGLKLKVNPLVLIPRPETEELAQWIITSNFPGNSIILDIGTGSGCIALALKSHLKNADVFGVDVSENALEVARQNALKNSLNVGFFQADILKWNEFEWKNFDVIVSNPPYIRESEKMQMHSNVLNFEPENALFVTDADPLIFYKSIAVFAKKYLTKSGILFFEINETQGLEMNKMLTDVGFCDIEIRKDIYGKNRMVSCRNI